MSGWVVLIAYLTGVLLATRGVLLWDTWQEDHPRRQLAADGRGWALLIGFLWPAALYFGVIAGVVWLLWKAATVGIRR